MVKPSCNPAGRRKGALKVRKFGLVDFDDQLKPKQMHDDSRPSWILTQSQW